MALALRFAVETLRMLSGLLIWSAHFLFIYVFTALICARRFYALEWLGIGIVAWGVAIVTVMALGGILTVMRPAWRRLRSADCSTSAFLDWMTLAFGGLALVAILWEVFPVLLVPTC